MAANTELTGAKHLGETMSNEQERQPVEHLVMRLRNHAMPDPNDEREVLHAPLLREAADEIEKLNRLLEFALAGLSSAPKSWGLDITHVSKIQREMSGE